MPSLAYFGKLIDEAWVVLVSATLAPDRKLGLATGCNTCLNLTSPAGYAHTTRKNIKHKLTIDIGKIQD